jgi:hypothetical protein
MDRRISREREFFQLELPFYEVEVDGKCYRNSVELFFTKACWWGVVHSWQRGDKTNYAVWKSGKRKHKNFWVGIVRRPFLIDKIWFLSVIDLRTERIPPWVMRLIDCAKRLEGHDQVVTRTHAIQ